MASIVLDGNDAPARVEDTDGIGTVPYEFWLGVQARSYTWYRQEPYRLNYSIGLVDALRSNPPSTEEWSRRLRLSFATISHAEYYDFSILARGSTVRLNVQLREN